jgi:hypothetical protein
MELPWMKSEEVVRLAQKVVNELRWDNEPQSKIDQFERIVREHKRYIEKQVGGRSVIPCLIDEVERLKIR